MSYCEHSKILNEEKELEKKAQELKRKRMTIEQDPAFLKDKINQLENEIVSLKKELAPYREAARQKRVDDYGNMKCTGRAECCCRDCTDL